LPPDPPEPPDGLGAGGAGLGAGFPSLAPPLVIGLPLSTTLMLHYSFFALLDLFARRADFLFLPLRLSDLVAFVIGFPLITMFESPIL
jgi:hypothetical protein